jgi:hypothetical protein
LIIASRLGDDDPIRQVIEIRREGPFCAGSIEAVGVQALIDLARSDRWGTVRIARCPGGTEFVVSSSLALEAGTVTGSQPRGFVEEEEFRVTVRCHDRPMPTPKMDHANQPTFHLPGSPYASTLVMEDAPVPHERSPLGGGDNLAEGCDTVLPGHR